MVTKSNIIEITGLPGRMGSGRIFASPEGDAEFYLMSVSRLLRGLVNLDGDSNDNPGRPEKQPGFFYASYEFVSFFSLF